MKSKLLIVSCLLLTGVVLCGADAEPKWKFRTEASEKAFAEGKKAFLNKDLKVATKKLTAAKKGAVDILTKKEVYNWQVGLKGLQDVLMLEQRVKTKPSWAYTNAQKRLLFYYSNPAGALFRNLIAELEKPEKKLIKKVEGFETRGPYSTRFGRFYCYKSKTPQFVIHGNRSLKWECKDESSQALVISRFPKDCSKFKYLCFWLYGTKGKNSKLYLYLRNEEKKKKQGRSSRQRFDGYQAQIPSHTGWKYIVLDMEKDFSKRGAGNLKNISGLQFQLPVKKSFITYVDGFVLIAKK